MLLTLRRLFAWTFALGSISFAAGFFGPMVLAPGANQGPLLGIFITGPLGALAGFGTGVWRELRGFRAGPLDVLVRGRPGLDTGLVARVLAAAVGLLLAFRGLAGLRQGEGRAAAAALVVSGAVLYYAYTGRAPTWFRR